MPSPPLPATTKSVFRARFEVRYMSNVYQTAFPYLSDAAVLVDDIAGAAAAIEGQLRGALLDVLPENSTYMGFVVEDLNQPLRLPVQTAGPGTAFGRASAAHAGQLSILFRRQTARRGRRGRGFNFLGPIPSAFMLNGFLTDAAMEAYVDLQAALVATIDDVGGGTLNICVATVVVAGDVRTVHAAACTGVTITPTLTDRSTRRLGRGQ